LPVTAVFRHSAHRRDARLRLHTAARSVPNRTILVVLRWLFAGGGHGDVAAGRAGVAPGLLRRCPPAAFAGRSRAAGVVPAWPHGPAKSLFHLEAPWGLPASRRCLPLLAGYRVGGGHGLRLVLPPALECGAAGARRRT